MPTLDQSEGLSQLDVTEAVLERADQLVTVGYTHETAMDIAQNTVHAVAEGLPLQNPVIKEEEEEEAKKSAFRGFNPYKKKPMNDPLVATHNFNLLDNLAAGDNGVLPPPRPSPVFTVPPARVPPSCRGEASPNSEDPKNSKKESQFTTEEGGFNTTAFAHALLDGNDGINWSEGEKNTITQAKHGPNTKKYSNAVLSAEKDFFECLKTHGSQDMKALLSVCTALYDPLQRTQDKLFYNVLGGNERREQARVILDRCLQLWGLRPKCLKGIRKGKALEPGSLGQKVKLLFYVFDKKGIVFDHLKDFNGPKEFHAVIKQHWAKTQKKEEGFGERKNEAQFDENGDDKILKAYLDGKFRPRENPEHAQWYMVYLLGRYFGLRGNQEIAKLQRKDVRCGFHTSGPDNGKRYRGIGMPNDKSNQLKLTNTRARSEAEYPNYLTANPEDPLCPVNFWDFYDRKCHPAAKRVFGREYQSTKARVFDPKKATTWYRAGADGVTANNIGHNTIGDMN